MAVGVAPKEPWFRFVQVGEKGKSGAVAAP